MGAHSTAYAELSYIRSSNGGSYIEHNGGSFCSVHQDQ